MRYTFHGHESRIDLKDIVAFEPELAAAAARAQREPNHEEAVAVVLDIFGGSYVRRQRAHLEVIGRRWADLAQLASGTVEEERVRAIPDRLAYRFDSVWPEGRMTLHLMLRAVALRTGCEMRDAPLRVTHDDITTLLEALEHGLRNGFARSLDAASAVEMLEAAFAAPEDRPTILCPSGDPSGNPAFEIDWAAEVTDRHSATTNVGVRSFAL